MTNFMSNTATCALLVPIGLSLLLNLASILKQFLQSYRNCKLLGICNTNWYARQHYGIQHSWLSFMGLCEKLVYHHSIVVSSNRSTLFYFQSYSHSNKISIWYILKGLMYIYVRAFLAYLHILCLFCYILDRLLNLLDISIRH